MDIASAVILLLAVSIFICRQRKIKAFEEKWREKSKQAFLSKRTGSNSEALSFDGSKATILDETSSVDIIRGLPPQFQSRIIAKNQSGEYFVFNFRSDREETLKHLEKSEAKIILNLKHRAKNH